MKKSTSNQKQLLFIILEFLSGLGFSILGGHIYLLFDSNSLKASIFYTFLVMFVSMFIGVTIMGYFHFKSITRSEDFSGAVGYSFLGMLLSLILYVALIIALYQYLPDYLSSVVLPIVLPLMGAVIGVNFLIYKKKIRRVQGVH